MSWKYIGQVLVFEYFLNQKGKYLSAKYAYILPVSYSFKSLNPNIFSHLKSQSNTVSYHFSKSLGDLQQNKFQRLADDSVFKYSENLVSKTCNTEFNACLVNLYETGNDYAAYHADNEKELGENPTIASLSLGGERLFHIKNNQ